MLQSAKALFKEKAPNWVVEKALRVRSTTQDLQFRHDDARRFARYRFRGFQNAELAHLEAKLIFHAHSLEKGLSHRDMRLGFGAAALQQLAQTMRVYVDRNFSRDGLAFQNSLSVVQAYMEAHEVRGERPLHLEPLFGSFLEDAKNANSNIGGVTVVNRPSNQESHASFEEVFLRRTSVREYARTEVKLEKITSAIDIATKAPSVCNRQPARVRIFTNSEAISEILKLQGGFTGYATPPALLLISVDQAAYLSPTERNQGFIDGGAFAMALLLCLENERLASCALNTMFDTKLEKRVRALAEVPDNESLIMFIAVGNFLEDVLAPKSFRFPASHITAIR